ncbi:MAG: 4-hydroxy-3-methylbut-2-enyl diphosphate reductase [Lachnospiraceae bacterium]|nr:4-hydroxy-3-methylbut-2-enyl diphosphate reductase [Lachnospiraceae bacterium]
MEKYATSTGGSVCVADKAGFCFGVERAVNTAYKTAERGGTLYTYGPIIHNEEVTRDLSGRGISITEDIDSLKDEDAVIILRSHGVKRSIIEKIRARGYEIVDTTCPFVKKIHRIVDEESAKGCRIVIVGNKNHPEVQGIEGWCNNEPFIIEKPEDAEKICFGENEKVCVVVQTTFNHEKLKDLVDILKKNCYHVNVVNTICNATEERQTEARNLAGKMDAMIVVGGARSSNTQKLYEICREECEDSFLIRTFADLEIIKIKAGSDICITAGASTPNNIIEEVLNYVRINF